MTEVAPKEESRDRAGSLADSAAVILLAVFLALELHVVWSVSITYDEFSYIGRGVATATQGQESVGPAWLGSLVSGAALRALGAREESAAALRDHDTSGYAYGERIVFDDNRAFSIPFAARGAESLVIAARLALLPFALLLAVVAWRWARALFGPWGGLCSLALTIAWPDVLGHGALATNDVPFSALALATGFAFDRFAARGGLYRLGVLALALGAAFAAKVTAGLLLAGLVAAAAIAATRPADPEPASVLHPFGAAPPRARALAIAASVALLAVGAVLVLGALSPGGGPVRMFLDRASSVATYHRGDAPITTRESGAWRTHLLALGLKAPLGTIAALALAAVAARETRVARASEAALHLPALAILGATCALATPLGSRYLLPAIPFLLVSAGRLAPWAAASRPRAAVVGAALFATALGCAIDHPFHATAANALARGRAWTLLDNSNVDWGGGVTALGQWQRAHRIDRVTVIPFGTVPVLDLVRDETGKVRGVTGNQCERLARLDAWGARGELAPPYPTLFAPEKGKVYAVSAHVLHHALRFQTRLAEAGLKSELVLGGARAPDGVVGGSFLIFDLRER